MLSFEALDRIRHRCDPAVDMGTDLGADTGALDQIWRQAAAAEAILRRVARHRTGRDDVAAAFGSDELRRLRPLLLAAAQAAGRPTRAIRPASRPAQTSHGRLTRVVLPPTWTESLRAITC